MTNATTNDRKLRGAWDTPDDLVDWVVDAAVDDRFVGRYGRRPIRVLDPACGDGRFLRAAARAIERRGGRAALTGIDIDPGAIECTGTNVPAADVVVADAIALGVDRAGTVLADAFDLVIGNPPYLSQLSTASTRGGKGSFGAGTYGDTAVDFLGLCADVAEPRSGRVALVLPQSVLASRDAEPVRRAYERRATMIWSSWDDRQRFDAAVHTCALLFEFGSGSSPADDEPVTWSHVVTARSGVPQLPGQLTVAGRLGDRVHLNANFRDEYYGLVPAVDDHVAGPPLITTGSIDPLVSRWGIRPVRFAGRRLSAPRVDLSRLDDRMRRWAETRLVPKVLVANQTSILEAWSDSEGIALPGVPVVAAYPHDVGLAARACDEVAAVLTSPIAAAWVWHRSAGTGLSARSVRVGPRVLAELPWPSGDLDVATVAAANGDAHACADAVMTAYGVSGAHRDRLVGWWAPLVERAVGRP